MFFAFALFALCAFRFIQVQHSTSLIEIPEEITRFCPHSDFCHVESANPSPPIEWSKLLYEPCCKSCSCAPDCGQNRTCCTPELDQYKLIEKLGAVCKSLNTKTNTFGDDETYFVVEECPFKDQICSSINISTWGSYSPVYSHSDGFIYHNKYCSSCNNQTDVVNFIPNLVCSAFQGPLSEIASNTLKDVKQSEDTCFVQFIAPLSIDISSQICHKYVVSDCRCTSDTAYFRRMRNLCGGLRALFRTSTVYYQNVFCFLCNNCYDNNIQEENIWKRYYTMCPVAWSKRFTSESSLIVLLDEGFRKDFEMSLSESAERRTVCFEETNNTTKVCRQVHCPEGQFRIGGRCKLLGETWYINNLQYYLKLTPFGKRQTMTRSMLEELNIEDISELYLQILNQFQMQDWEIELFYNVGDNSTAIQYIVVVLVLRTQEVKSSSLIDKVLSTLQGTWTLPIFDTYWTFLASFNKFIFYHGLPILRYSSYTPLWPISDSETSLDAALLITSLKNGKHFKDVQHEYKLCLTKLYFCEIIDIYADEFVVIGFAKEELYLVKQHKKLGNGEFVISKFDKGEPSEIRVCLSDVVEGKAVKIFTELKIMALYQMLIIALIR